MSNDDKAPSAPKILKANRIYNMDCREGLRLLEDESIDMVMTSPPFWSLRDYGDNAIAVWDEETGCCHEWGKKIKKEIILQTGNPEYQRPWREQASRKNVSAFCTKCSAWRGKLGLEPHFDLYIKHLCSIFDEIRRVLKRTGTLWVNIGDTYNGSGGAGSQYSKWRKRHTQFGKRAREEGQSLPTNIRNYPKKCLCLIPFRFVAEMVDRGWLLRNTII